jgi:hypothetical protein
MEREAVREYVEHAQSTIESSPQMGEATTKAAVLQDFLELLEWEIPANTELEYSVKAFGRTFSVDYSLVLEGAPVAFLEAKGVDTPLTDDHREQIQEYMKSEDVNLGILTNGKEYAFFRRQVIDSKVNVNTLAETTLQNLPNRISILRAFTKEAIQNEEWIDIFNRIEELEDAKSQLERNKGRFAARISENMSDWVSDTISSQAETQAKEMIDRLIQDIETEIVSDGAVSPEEQDDAIPVSVPEESTDTSGEYVIALQNDGQAIATFAANYQSEAMAEAVSHLIENYDLISMMDSIPYVPGEKNAVINDRPVHPDEREMKTYRDLPDGYYLFTNLSKEDKIRYIRRFAERCGLEVEFESGW